MGWNCQGCVGITRAAMRDFREQEMGQVWESWECHHLSKATTDSNYSQIWTGFTSCPSCCFWGRGCAGRALGMSLAVPTVSWSEIPVEPELPWGLAQPRAQFPSRGDFWGQGGSWESWSRAGCARAHWDPGRVWRELRSWERLSSGISLGGSAGMGWTVWECLEKWLGKGIGSKISFGGSSINHLEGRGQEMGEGQREFQ